MTSPSSQVGRSAGTSTTRTPPLQTAVNDTLDRLGTTLLRAPSPAAAKQLRGRPPPGNLQTHTYKALIVPGVNELSPPERGFFIRLEAVFDELAKYASASAEKGQYPQPELARRADELIRAAILHADTINVEDLAVAMRRVQAGLSLKGPEEHLNTAMGYLTDAVAARQLAKTHFPDNARAATDALRGFFYRSLHGPIDSSRCKFALAGVVTYVSGLRSDHPVVTHLMQAARQIPAMHQGFEADRKHGRFSHYQGILAQADELVAHCSSANAMELLSHHVDDPGLKDASSEFSRSYSNLTFAHDQLRNTDAGAPERPEGLEKVDRAISNFMAEVRDAMDFLAQGNLKRPYADARFVTPPFEVGG